MADLIFSTQRDEEGNTLFSSQQVVTATKPVFAVQRNNSGAAVFAYQSMQAGPSEINPSALLKSTSNVIATLVVSQAVLVARLTSQSGVLATLNIADKPLAARLVSSSLVRATVNTADKVIRAILRSESSFSAALSVGSTSLGTLLTSSSNLLARIQFGVGSTIPRNAKLRAVPADEEVLQIVRYRGDTYADAFTVFNEKTGDITNIDGCTFKMSVSIGTKCDPDRLLQYTLMGVVDDAENGIVSFAPNVDQSNLVGFYFYDVEMRDSQGVVRTLISDSYVYKQDITP